MAVGRSIHFAVSVLSICFLGRQAAGTSIVKNDCSFVQNGTNTKEWCLRPDVFLTASYHCSLSAESLCGRSSYVGHKSLCWPVDNPNITYSCHFGEWKYTGVGNALSRHKRASCSTNNNSNVTVVLNCFVDNIKDKNIIGAVGAIFCAFFCPEVKQNRPPNFNSCPADITVYADAGMTEKAVSWTEPTASDPDGDQVSVSRGGPGPNSVFPEGATSITYRARDSQDFADYCFFVVRVKVKRCQYPSYVPHAVQTCDHSNIYGSVCSHTCEPGYELPNMTQPYDVTCGFDEKWSPSFPTCQPVSCGSTPSVTGGQVACPRQPVYPEYCSLVCDPGFQHTGSYFVSCQVNATWSIAQPCYDRESPKFPNGCSPNQQLYSGPLMSPVTVTWPAPVTTDNGQGQVTFTSNPVNGSSLAVGFHLVRVTATDDSANSASCNFLVVVEARKCPSLTAPAYGSVTCTSGYVEGSECTVSCYPGYQVQGDATVQCLQTEMWNATLPVCEAVVCPSVPQVTNGSFVCPSGRQYPSACSLICDTGFSTFNSTFIQCLADGTWSAPGSCRDVKAPEFANGCADNIEIYQARLGAQTLVQWNDPFVSDNSGGAVSLTSDVTSGSAFPVGVTWVTYTATDVSNNSRSCRFSVTVTTLSCDPPALDPTGRGLMLYNCSNGHVHGASCTLDCAYGYPLVGSGTITCERDDTTHPPTMVWEWPGPSAVAPVCRENNCTDLPAPKNGALACNLGNFGWDCMMFCQSGWDVPAQTDGHFYCTNSNNYWTPSSVPDCLVRILPWRVRLNTDLFYYTNACNMSTNEIKTKFVERMNNSVWRDACINSCELQNLQVTCGPLTAGKKRSADYIQSRAFVLFLDETNTPNRRYKRQTQDHYVHIAFDIVMDYDESSTSKEQVYQSVQTMRGEIYNELTTAANAGTLDFDTLTAGQYGVGYPTFSADCPIGTFYRERDNSDVLGMSCAGCGAGYYLPYDPVTGTQASQCEACPVGSYADVDNATSCTSCPPGWSTLSAASTSSEDCIELCPAGNVSHNGFVPCQPCPPGRYQSRDGATTCDLCPVGSWTEVTGATSLDQCIPADVHLKNSILTSEVSGTWSGLTVTSWVLLHSNTLTFVTLTLSQGSSTAESLTLVAYNGNISATNIPSNGTSSASVEVASDTWHRVVFTVDPQTTTGSLYFGTTQVLSYTHATLTTSATAVLTVEAVTGKVQASGLHAKNGMASSSDITAHPQTCSGNTTDNILTWSPAVSSLVFPSECDALDECAQSPCGSHLCENQASGFVCHCQAGWTGVTCSVPPDPCEEHQCLHGATCVPAGVNYTCTCPSGYTGDLCELPIVDGGWRDWTAWSECTVTCGGGGTQHRQRLCNNPAPLNGGVPCTGSDTETLSCGQSPCPVHGNWSVWGQWSICSASCGGGERHRNRTCDNPAPLHGGEDCEGSSTEEETCNTDLCPVDGGWTPWSNWTDCSVTCGVGTMSRDRACTNPPPANGGASCSGLSSETQVCNLGTCPECPQLIRPRGSLLICKDSSAPFLRTCDLTCAPGYISPVVLPQYTCGEETDYLWSHQRDVLSSTVLPETCQRPTSAERATLTLSVPMSMTSSCDATKSTSVRDAITQNMVSSVDCMQQGKCQADVTAGCDTGSTGRRKRSTGTLVLSVNMTFVFGSIVVLDPNDTTTMQQYIDFLNTTGSSATVVLGNATNNVFTVAIGNQIISPDLTALTYTTTLACPAGSGNVGGLCVECPAGSKEESGQCVLCPLGQYQDQSGSTSCLSCPAGLTWDVLGASNINQCIYPLTTTLSTSSPTSVTSTTASGTATTNTSTANQATLSPAAGHSQSAGGISNMVIIVSVVCASVVILGLAIVLTVYKCKQNNTITKMRRRRSSFISVGRVTPLPLDEPSVLTSRPPTAASIASQPPSYWDTFNVPPPKYDWPMKGKKLPPIN